jgi:hypothetical protein
MSSDKEYLDIVKEISSCKDTIKQSSQKIISKLNGLDDSVDIDKEVIEILTALGKIGTISGNAGPVNSYVDAWNDCICDIRRMKGDWGQKIFLKDMLNRICMISFDIKKKGKKFEINLPKIDVNFQKFQT